MNNLNENELAKIKAEIRMIHEDEIKIDHSKFMNAKVKRRYVMEKRADDIAYRKRNKRKKEIFNMFKDEFNQMLAEERRKKVKIVVKDGCLMFLGVGDDEK